MSICITGLAIDLGQQKLSHSFYVLDNVPSPCMDFLSRFGLVTNPHAVVRHGPLSTRKWWKFFAKTELTITPPPPLPPANPTPGQITHWSQTL